MLSGPRSSPEPIRDRSEMRTELRASWVNPPPREVVDHRNVFPIPRVWQTYRTQNPVLAKGGCPEPKPECASMNAGVAALTISLLENPSGRRGHWSSSRADQSLWNESVTIAMPPRFAITVDPKLVTIGGAMGPSRCPAFGRFVGEGALYQALALGNKLCFRFISLTMGRSLTAFGPNENQVQCLAPAKPHGIHGPHRKMRTRKIKLKIKKC